MLKYTEDHEWLRAEGEQIVVGITRHASEQLGDVVFIELPEVGREVVLFTHYAQKEDSVSLYGFLREGERRLFRDVQKVSGIGACSAGRVALPSIR